MLRHSLYTEILYKHLHVYISFVQDTQGTNSDFTGTLMGQPLQEVT